MAELKDFILEHSVKGKDVTYIMKELVRCKDCKFFERLTSEMTFCIRGSTEEEPEAMVMTENDYCSKGEQRDTTPSFMSEWAREIEEQLNSISIRKDEQ